ncbi:hypothetical protein [uncultured Anaerovibrio sp.]|uniref:hypothetical protein n=1 Tax=uncultured Anaerovibrio sp. TaxID=361586 RepID=UPI002636D078|nr:hypothetical protein [uncultured Anaerovibrio sp.]
MKLTKILYHSTITISNITASEKNHEYVEITCGSYNDGKRGFKGWNSEDDTKLFNILDYLNDKGVKFALSNVAEHKGLKNEKMIDWQETGGYQLHNVMFDYNNCNYQANNKHNKTVEVLITN